MSVRFNIDKDKIELVLEKEFSVDDVIHAADSAISQSDSPLPLLVDVTNSNELKSGDELKKFADFLGSKKEHIVPKLAILVANIGRFGTGRQVGTYLEFCGIESNPFYDKDKALLWLKRDK